ncbi:MAG: hypothetical protein ACI9OJ_001867 [Myxococcota bacterium]|jgi:hypothetical protein
MSDEPDKKQRVIHTRVSDTLDEEIRRRAEGLGVSVSNLIRNVLGHSFGLVEDVIVEGARVARSARGEHTDTSAEPGELIGWQPLILERNALCERCNAILPRGAEASLAVHFGAGPQTLICGACLPKATDKGQ